MTCRHAKGDLLARTPNPDAYEIERVEQVESNLVVMVKYSSCAECSFDSKKVMVYLDTSMTSAVFWRTIDPHFSESTPADRATAPAPRARFPADEDGWCDAVSYARGKS